MSAVYTGVPSNPVDLSFRLDPEECPVCLEEGQVYSHTDLHNSFCTACKVQFLAHIALTKCPVCCVEIRSIEGVRLEVLRPSPNQSLFSLLDAMPSYYVHRGFGAVGVITALVGLALNDVTSIAVGGTLVGFACVFKIWNSDCCGFEQE